MTLKTSQNLGVHRTHYRAHCSGINSTSILDKIMILKIVKKIFGWLRRKMTFYGIDTNLKRFTIFFFHYRPRVLCFYQIVNNLYLNRCTKTSATY